MIKLVILLPVVLLCLSAMGCGDEPVPAEPQGTAPAKPATPPTLDIQPVYTLDVTTSDSDPTRYTVSWTAQVNTGGWNLTTERVLVEDSMGKTTARVYAILEQPGPDEMVTQAIQTLTGSHDAGEQKIDQAELSIKRIRRGQDGGLATYAVVKRTN